MSSVLENQWCLLRKDSQIVSSRKTVVLNRKALLAGKSRPTYVLREPSLSWGANQSLRKKTCVALWLLSLYGTSPLRSGLKEKTGLNKSHLCEW